jgi:hypothetical protein
MAGRGPAPKEQHQRERDTRRRQADVVTLPDDGVVRGPALPDGYTPDVELWYSTWRSAPQAALFEATDWQRLLLLAPIVQSYFTRPSAAALSEIRLNEERLGATYVDRLRAKNRIDREQPETDEVVGGNVTPIRARRASLRDRLAPDPAPASPEDKPGF